jgi:two-component system, OmpR family, sensor histidine kinase TctE
LLDNAIRYTPSGGQVTVKLRRSASSAIISVIDTGPGMPSDEIGRAGDRFFRGSNITQPGSGLGLAIVQSIAARLGGELRLSANAGGPGLTVSIVLPLVSVVA